MGRGGDVPILSLSGFLKLLAIPLTFSLVSCTPDTFVEAKFNNNGIIEYVFKGESNGTSYIKHIEARFNKGEYRVFPQGEPIAVSIIEGLNSGEGRAVNSRNLIDSSPARFEFLSPTQQEAEAAIEALLGEKGLKEGKEYSKKELILLGEQTEIIVDYFLTLPDGRNAVINSAGHGKNLEKELADQAILWEYGIDNLYVARLTIDKTQEMVRAFLQPYFP